MEAYESDNFRMVGIAPTDFRSANAAIEQIARHHNIRPYSADCAIQLYTFNLDDCHIVTVTGHQRDPVLPVDDLRVVSMYVQKHEDQRSALAHLTASKSLLTKKYEALVIWDSDELMRVGGDEVADKIAQDMVKLFGRLAIIAEYSMLTTSEGVEAHPGVDASPKMVEAALLPRIPIDLSDLRLPGLHR